MPLRSIQCCMARAFAQVEVEPRPRASPRSLVLAGAAGSLSRSSDVVNSFGVPTMPSHAAAFALWLRGNATLKLRESYDAVSLEGGMSRTPKIDRARRNALKAASLVLGAVLATGALHRQASAAPGGNGNGNGGTTATAATATGTATATATAITWRQLLCAGHANPDARGLSADRNLGSGRRGCGAFPGLRADQGNGQSHLEQRVGQMGRRVEFAGSHTARCSG